jgi:predicted DCC family thiol-disulfide oxidoreductase YuxK
MMTVFYDGACNLCAREIAHYQRIAPPGLVRWDDITQSPAALENEGITLAQGLKQLHVKDAEGKIHVGVDAFIILWKQLPYWRLLGWLVALPVIRHGAGMLYRYFADWRFKRLAHCQRAQQNETRNQ